MPRPHEPTATDVSRRTFLTRPTAGACAGQHSIVRGPDGKTDYFVYHVRDEAMKARQLCIERLDWTPQVPRLRVPTHSPQPVPKR